MYVQYSHSLVCSSIASHRIASHCIRMELVECQNSKYTITKSAHRQKENFTLTPFQTHVISTPSYLLSILFTLHISNSGQSHSRVNLSIWLCRCVAHAAIANLSWIYMRIFQSVFLFRSFFPLSFFKTYSVELSSENWRIIYDGCVCVCIFLLHHHILLLLLPLLLLRARLMLRIIGHVAFSSHRLCCYFKCSASCWN